MEIVNAKITSTSLGLENGILTAYLYLEMGIGSQGFGGYALDSWNAGKNRRIGVSYGAEFILQILNTVGVENWEDLPGKHIRVKRSEGWVGSIEAIGNIVKDKWFDPKKLSVEMRYSS
jgi:hypothetical protein